MHDFHGWKPGALWEDIKWNARHFKDIERLAIGWRKILAQVMTGFCKAIHDSQGALLHNGFSSTKHGHGVNDFTDDWMEVKQANEAAIGHSHMKNINCAIRAALGATSHR